MCNIKWKKEKKNEWKIWWFDFKMIFSPFAYRHQRFTFHFISFHHFKADFHFSDYLTFGFPNECFASIFHYMLLVSLRLSSRSHPCYFYILRMVMVSVDYLSVQKGNINYIAGFFSCSSCATKKNTRTHTVYCTQAHILNSLRYDVYPGNENEIERENDVCTQCVLPLTQAAMIIRNRKRNREKKTKRPGNT